MLGCAVRLRDACVGRLWCNVVGVGVGVVGRRGGLRASWPWVTVIVLLCSA